LFAALEQLSETDLGRTITIRGEAHSLMQACKPPVGALLLSCRANCDAGQALGT
jgi:hypothetical protein